MPAINRFTKRSIAVRTKCEQWANLSLKLVSEYAQQRVVEFAQAIARKWERQEQQITTDLWSVD